MKKQQSLIAIVAALLVLVLAACTPTALPQTGAKGDEKPAVSDQLPGPVLAAQRWVAEQLGVTVEEVKVASFEQKDWTDSCLGLGGPAEMCLQAITPGYQVQLTVNGQEYEIRTDQTGEAVRSPQLAGEVPGASEQQPEPVSAAQTWLAGKIGLAVEQVTVVSFAPAEWTDSCLGLGGPAESCLQAITPGFLVKLSAGGQEYEVRTDATGAALRSPELGSGSAEPTSLAGTRWTLVSFSDASGETPVITGAAPTLEFGADGQAAGTGGCNQFGGQYSLIDGQLSFGEMVTTEMACDGEGIMAQEQRYYRALEGTAGFDLLGDELRIIYGNGQGTLLFTRNGS